MIFIILLLVSLGLFAFASCKAASIADKRTKKIKGDNYEEEDL